MRILVVEDEHTLAAVLELDAERSAEAGWPRGAAGGGRR